MYTLMICFEDMIVKLSDDCKTFTCVCEVKMGENGLEGVLEILCQSDRIYSKGLNNESNT